MSSKKRLQFRLDPDFLEALANNIEVFIAGLNGDISDKLLKAVLFDLRLKLAVKIAMDRPMYAMTFTAPESLALLMLYTVERHQPNNLWFANELRKVSERIHQYYS